MLWLKNVSNNSFCTVENVTFICKELFLTASKDPKLNLVNECEHTFSTETPCLSRMCLCHSEQAFYSDKSDFISRFNFSKSPRLYCCIFLRVNRTCGTFIIRFVRFMKRLFAKADVRHSAETGDTKTQ